MSSAKKQARDLLIELYNQYMCDFLTAEGFAEQNGLTSEQGQALINLARVVARSPHPEA